MEFATGALGTLLPKLGQLLQDEYNLHKGAKKNIEFLTRELESTQAALRNVGEVPPEQLSELVKIWARDARELSYDMEDIVDTFLVRVQGPGSQSKNGSKRFIKKMKDFVNKAKTRHDIGQDIEDIKERVKEVAERRERYMANAITPTQTFIDPRITALYTKAADLVGIDEAREELIMRLTKGDDISAQQRIVSVIGFGGLGKTTLAKAVYEKIKGQFDSVAFVPVGRSPDLKKVFKDILINLDKQKYMHFNFAILDERHLIDEFQEFLENKRYFIVIDDVWEARSWETIKLALVENNSGSRIIITTRKHEVAREAGGVIYKLQPLSDENSRKLFFARIVGGESKSSNHQPDDDLSNKILRKCGGIPLAIITMASVLVSKPRNEWTEVLRSIGFANKGNLQVENTMKILSFSYYDLPSHLRTCLLHLSVFPEDYFIEKRPLIWMWIAEGFVQEKQGISSFEIGEGYFNELVNRSMIQPSEEWEGDDVVCGCEVHDMVLDLIRSISCEENFVTMLDNNNSEGVPLLSIHGRVRRLALQNNRVVEAQTKDMQQVRSFVSYGCDPDKRVPLSRFKLIRVLAIDASQCMERCHIEHLQNLLHLRYLRLSGKEVVLPEELVGTLKFLQTLDVEGLGTNTEVVLKSAGLQTQLLCLRFRGPCRVLIDGGIGKLTSLKELQMFYYQQEEEPLRRSVKELGRLRELRVLRLRIPDLLSTDVQIDMLESLRSMEKMEHLSLIMLFLVYADTTMWQAARFRLPRNLRKLVLRFIIFSRFPSFCINPSCVPNLSQLLLNVDDIDDQDLRTLGGLPELCYLHLSVGHYTMEGTPVCNTGDGYFLFQKLRRCTMHYSEVLWLLPSEDGFRFRMRHVRASMTLGSERMDVRGGNKAGVALTLIPSAQELWFGISAQESGCGCLSLDYFAWLQNVNVSMDCGGASAAVVEQVEAALRRAADVHPNRPSLQVIRHERNTQ